ncbi:Siroheme synthase [Pseudovibrio axinellae]|uniref:uroporphyrinogen-III C-methyltransferase n=1 Tax=Pseudovibrio axinellae TaxID=989403 RepID=A0A165T1P6_9HYPH|nr:uroporphyrinogen-III C-methyltransferase [Pseudovibrio axinellae]KZL05175.1 Siroheme synthase [Pseudovibrio axinellae]SER51096.1 uroporphyrin-III C-methyltransferase [Pseudovibrio axinellae]
MTGKVYLIGAGPGDVELLTLRALRMIREADAVVYDRLVSDEIMEIVPSTAQKVFVGKTPQNHPVGQEQINQILVDLAKQGLTVARLKGGDPLIFGRGSEEAAHLRSHGIAVQYAPGITAAQGAASSCGVPLTHRGLATGVQYVTGHTQADGELDLDWKSLASEDTTLVVYMGVANISQIAMRLMAAGLADDTPVMAVANATTPRESRMFSVLGRIASDSREAGLKAPVLYIIGKVVTVCNEWPVNQFLAATENEQEEYAGVASHA